MSTYNFEVRARIGPETVIVLSGELDLATVKMFEAVLEELEFPGLRDVVLDLEWLTFIDAAGLRGVLKLHATCLRRSVALTIERGPSNVQRLFVLTGTDRALPFVSQ